MYKVFNAEQAAQLPDRFYPQREAAGAADEIREPEGVLGEYLKAGGPRVRWLRQDRAYYRAADDLITLPERSQFKTPEAYYATAFHEAGHSTGHPDRLARGGVAHSEPFRAER